MTTDYTIRPLEKSDKRSDFDCDNDALNNYFEKKAGQNQFRHHYASHLVAISPGDTILGYLAFSVGSILKEEIPDGKYPNFPLPILRIARLAVQKDAQKRKIGRNLMKKSFYVAVEQAKHHGGCVGLVVDAKDSAIKYYQEKFGFEFLTDTGKGDGEGFEDTTPMFLPIKDIKKAIAEIEKTKARMKKEASEESSKST